MAYAPRPKREVTCEICGKVAFTHAPNWRFCSQACKDAFWNKSRACADCGISMWKYSNAPEAARCKECRLARREHGTVVMYKKAGCRCGECRAAQADSMRDYYQQRRAQGRPTKKSRGENRRYHLSAAARLAIYERDGWSCQLCGDPVDQAAHFNDPLAPTLDHIEPQSAALIPDHSPANLRLAHRICNARRGNRLEAAC